MSQIRCLEPAIQHSCSELIEAGEPPGSSRDSELGGQTDRNKPQQGERQGETASSKLSSDLYPVPWYVCNNGIHMLPSMQECTCASIYTYIIMIIKS